MEGELLHFKAPVLRKQALLVVTVPGLVLHVVDLAKTFKADLGVLCALDEGDQLDDDFPHGPE